MEEIIEAQNLDFTYEDGTKVLQDFNISIEKGSFVALLGHNGCGKSSFARLLNGTLTPTEGYIYINKIDTKNEEMIFEVRKNCGLVFQNPDNQIIASIVEDDVAFAPENLGIEPKEIRKRVDEALKSVDLYDYRNSSAYHLSGGQKQRVAIAGIVAMRPNVIVLDEPTAMLDPKGRKEVMNTLKRLNCEYKITVILITHNMEEAVLADRVVVLEKGNILLDGSPRAVFSQYEILKKSGLSVPQITKLSYELKNLGFPIENDILSIDEFTQKITDIFSNKEEII